MGEIVKLSGLYLNRGGVREFLRSQQVAGMITPVSSRIASQAGAGYGTDVKVMPTRVISSAYTATPEAMRREASEQRLLRAFHTSGGGRA